MSDAAIAHRRRCRRHQAQGAALKCYVNTRSGKRCQRKACEHMNSEFLPTCGQHRAIRIRAGRCQATETCGQLCWRLAPADPPFNLCSKHAGGTNTLPSYFLKVPVELRLMIYRYLFPNKVSSIVPIRSAPWRCPEPQIHTAILKLNREIYAEARDVLYGETHFQVHISRSHVRLLRKEWIRPPYFSGLSRGRGFDITEDIDPISVQCIKNLSIEVVIDYPVTVPAHGLHDALNTVLQGELFLFETRDSVRKFVQLLNPAHKCRKLIVKPIVNHYHASAIPAKIDEIICALRLVMEPFKELHSIRTPRLSSVALSRREGKIHIGTKNCPEDDSSYRNYQRKWYRSLKSADPTLLSQPSKRHRARREKKLEAQAQYLAIEEFIGSLYKYEFSVRPNREGQRLWSVATFPRLQEVLHVARVAYEQSDLSTLGKIKIVITEKWVSYQRSLQVHKNAVGLMLESMNHRSLHEDYPDVFTEYSGQENEDGGFSNRWPQINVKEGIPNRQDQGVVFKEDDEREYLRKGDMEWIQLKTPATMCAAQLAQH